jgi:flavin reductase (DIM6/NTAB) family NADH-FMN oxidoreductase RutF
LGKLEDMEEVDVTLDCFSYPMPCALVVVNVEGKPNYLTVVWFSMVNFKPTCISWVSLGYWQEVHSKEKIISKKHRTLIKKINWRSL